MNPKSYFASSTAEAMEQVKRDLGSDAIILHTRKIRKKGIAGFFGKKIIEVIAAKDETYSDRPTKEEYVNNLQMQEALKAIRNLSNDLATEEEIEKKNAKNEQDEALANEVGDLKIMVSQLVEQMQELKNEVRNESVSSDKNKDAVNVQNDTFSSQVTANTQTDNNYDEEPFYQQMRQKLRDKYVTDETIDLIFNSFKVSGDELYDESQIKDAMREILQPIENIKIGPKNQTLLFAGPTGVGKTTTLAKLAAKLTLIDGCSVGIITADTFRIAAVEQLRTYSDILGIPFTVIYKPQELKNVLEAYQDKDFILIDTAGRSHKSSELKDNLVNLLKYLKNVEVFLVMSLTTGYNDIVNIMDSYSFIKDYKFIFTKLDESDSMANILNIKANNPAPLSYFTTGQNVPDDIEMASSDKIIKYILEE